LLPAAVAVDATIVVVVVVVVVVVCPTDDVLLPACLACLSCFVAWRRLPPSSLARSQRERR
jgi:hypothetical protein